MVRVRCLPEFQKETYKTKILKRLKSEKLSFPALSSYSNGTVFFVVENNLLSDKK